MAGEVANVEVRTQGDDDIFWTVVYINGFEISNRITIDSIQAGERIAQPIRRIVEDAFRIGYRKGFANCQNVIREAIGLK